MPGPQGTVPPPEVIENIKAIAEATRRFERSSQRLEKLTTVLIAETFVKTILPR